MMTLTTWYTNTRNLTISCGTRIGGRPLTCKIIHKKKKWATVVGLEIILVVIGEATTSALNKEMEIMVGDMGSAMKMKRV